MEESWREKLSALEERVRRLEEAASLPHLAPEAQPEEGVPAKQVGHIYKMEKMHPNPHVMGILGELEDHCGDSGDRGRLSYVGVFSSGGRQSTWVRHDVSADSLLRLIENRSAERVLACIGNGDRLALLLAILKKPMTVAQMVESCGFNSTGQVYHLLTPLITADLVKEAAEEGKGVYAVQPHRVQGILMLLSGISDMLDEKYTQGRWEEEA